MEKNKEKIPNTFLPSWGESGADLVNNNTGNNIGAFRATIWKSIQRAQEELPVAKKVVNWIKAGVLQEKRNELTSEELIELGRGVIPGGYRLTMDKVPDSEGRIKTIFTCPDYGSVLCTGVGGEAGKETVDFLKRKMCFTCRHRLLSAVGTCCAERSWEPLPDQQE